VETQTEAVRKCRADIPIYAYRCVCGSTQDEYRKIAERDQAPVCDICGTVTTREIVPTSVAPDLKPYFDDNLETFIHSKQHRREVMKAQGVSEKFGQHWWTGESAKRKRKY
jgi:hypothetical protein